MSCHVIRTSKSIRGNDSQAFEMDARNRGAGDFRLPSESGPRPLVLAGKAGESSGVAEGLVGQAAAARDDWLHEIARSSLFLLP